MLPPEKLPFYVLFGRTFGNASKKPFPFSLNRIVRLTLQCVQQLIFVNLPGNLNVRHAVIRGAEDSLHWQLDFTLGDDRNTSMAKTCVQIMKKVALPILRLVRDSDKISMKRMRYDLSLDFENGIEKCCTCQTLIV